MNEEDIKLAFDIDLSTLQSSLSQAQQLIQKTLRDADFSKLDSQLRDVSSRIDTMSKQFQGLSQSMIDSTTKANAQVAELVNQLNKAAIGFDKIGNAAKALETGALADTFNRAASRAGVTGLPQTGYQGARGTSGRFVSGNQVADMQIAKAMTDGIIAENKRGNDSMMAANTAMRAQEEAKWNAYYLTLAAHAKAADEQRAAADRASAQETANSVSLYRQKIQEAVGQLRQGGGVFGNAWNSNLGFSDEQISKYREDIQAAGYNMRTLDMASRSFWGKQIDMMGQHLIQWGGFILAMQAYQVLTQDISISLQEGLRTAAEFQQQTVQLQSFQRVGKEAGIGMNPASSGQVWADASQLAMKYGDNVNDVVQDLTLWYKTTGDLNNSMYLTNEAMKFQIVTGTSLEDTYRTLTALQNQASGMKMGLGDNSTFDLSKSAEFLNKVYAAALVAGAGMKQFAGDELTTTNAANILMHAMEQDTESLKKLGLNVSQAIALNQSLITVMGNTGSGADSAAERIARLVGGFAELSRSAKAAAVQKDLGADAYANMQKILASGQAQGNILTALLGFWETLNTKQQNALSTALAGNRQYQIQQGVMESIAGIFKKIEQAEKDRSALDQAATQMMDTFNTKVGQLNANWQVTVAIIGKSLIPVLEEAMGVVARLSLGVGALFAANAEKKDNFSVLGGELKSAGVNLKNTRNTTNIANPLGYSTFNIAGTHPDAEGALRDYLQGQIDAKFNAVNAGPNGLTPSELLSFERAETYVKSGDTNAMLRGLGSMHPGFTGGKNMAVYLGGPALAGDAMVGIGESSYDLDHLTELQKIQWQKNQGLGLGANQGSGGGIAPATPPGKAGGVRDAAQQDKTALDSLIDAYHRYADARKDATSGDEAEITALTRKQQVYGQNDADMNKMISVYNNERTQLTATNTVLEQYRTKFQAILQAEEAHQKSLPKSSQQYSQYQSVIDRTATELNSVNHAIQENNNQLTENQYKIIETKNALADTNYQKFMTEAQRQLDQLYKEEREGLVSVTTVERQRNTILATAQGLLGHYVTGTVAATNANTAFQQSTNGSKDAIVEEMQSLSTSINDMGGKAMSGFLQSMEEIQRITGGPGMEATLQYEQRYIDLKRQEADWNTEIVKLVQQAQGTPFQQQALDIQNLGQEYYQAANAANALAEKQAQLQNSPFYQAVSGAIGSLGNDVSTSAVNSLFGINSQNAAVQNIDAEITALNNKKSLADEIYQAEQYHTQAQIVAHNTMMYNIGQEIQKLNEEKQTIQSKIENPSIIQKLAENFTKSFIDGMMKQFSSQAMSMFFKVKPDPALQQAFSHFDDYLKNDFVNPVTDFTTSIGSDTSSDSTFVGAVAMFGQYTGTFAQAMAQVSAGGGMSSIPGVSASGFNWDGVPAGIFNTSSPTSSPSFPIGGGSPSGGAGSFLGAISGGSGGFGGALPIIGGIGAVAAGIPALMSSLRQPGTPTGGAGLPGLGAGSGQNFSGNWMQSSTQGVMQDVNFLSAAPPGSGGLNASADWIPALTGPQAFSGNILATALGMGGGGAMPSALGIAGVLSLPSVFGRDANGEAVIPGGMPKGIGGGIGGLQGGGSLLKGVAANGNAFTGMWSDVGSLGKYFGMAGAAYGLYSAITGGGGIGNALSAAMSMAAIAGWTGPIGLGLDAAAFIAGLIGVGNHDVPANMPDKYNTQVYGQGMADLFAAGLNGHPTWGANGTQFTMNSSLSQMTGGIGMKAFIEETLAKYPTQGSAPAWLQPMYNTLLKLFGASSNPNAEVMHWGHNIGQEWITGPGADGQVHSYQDYLNAMNQFINSYTQNLQGAAQATIVALNQFGSGVGFLPAYWDTPGFDYPSDPSQPPVGAPGTPGSPPPPTPPPPGGPPGGPPPYHGPHGPPGGKGYAMQSAYNYSPSGIGLSSGQGGNITTSVNLDGREIARSTQAYNLRTARQGFQRIT